MHIGFPNTYPPDGYLVDSTIQVLNNQALQPGTTLGSKGGTVVRALASHQCGPSSNPGVDTICGLSLLLVVSLALRGFCPGTTFSPLLKNQHFQIPIRPGIK